MAESAKVTFPKLSQSNWGSWKQRMEWLLESQDLWEVINSAKPEPVTDEWKKLDRKARAQIGLCLDESQFKLVKNAESAKGMWTALQEHHEKATMSTVVHYLNQLCSANLSEGGSMDAHLSNMEELFDKLAAAGETLKESLQIAMILRSLPSSYRSLVQSLQSRADADWTVVMVKARLLDEFNQRRERDDSLSEDMKAMKLNAWGGGSMKNEKVCYFCQKPGHFRKNCKKWLAQKDDSDSDDAAEKRHEYSEAKVKPKAKQAQDMNNMLCFMAGDGISSCWLIDSGATRHMTCDRSFFAELRTDVDSKVTLADGNKTKVSGIGHGVVFGENGSGERVAIKLENVLYVPELDGGLISVSQLTAKGFIVKFGKKRCDILNGCGQTVVVGDKVDNLYQLRRHERSLKVKGSYRERCQRRDPIVLKRVTSADLPLPPVEEPKATKPPEIIHWDRCGSKKVPIEAELTRDEIEIPAVSAIKMAQPLPEDGWADAQEEKQAEEEQQAEEEHQAEEDPELQRQDGQPRGVLPVRFNEYLFGVKKLTVVEPEKYREALQTLDWKHAMESELETEDGIGKWELMLPGDKTAVGPGWVTMAKRNEVREALKGEAPLVANSYHQRCGENYFREMRYKEECYSFIEDAIDGICLKDRNLSEPPKPSGTYDVDVPGGYAIIEEECGE